METTKIHFDPKQDFETIEQIIKNNFQNYRYRKGDYISGMDSFMFDHNNETIYCLFYEDNALYYDNDLVENCSTLASDIVSENKTEAFRKIASHFNCKFFPNDCKESTLEVFKNDIDFKKPIIFWNEFEKVKPVTDGDYLVCDVDGIIKVSYFDGECFWGSLSNSTLNITKWSLLPE